MMNRVAIFVRYGLFAVGLTICFTGAATGVSLSPARLNFGNSPQVVKVSNSGSTTLRLGRSRIVGANARDFSMTTTCGSVLSAGADCTVSISFAPTASGARSASLRFDDDLGASPQAVSLTGTGQFMALSADRTHLVNTFTNKPVFISGDTAQDLSVQLCKDSDVDRYLANRAAKHMNAIWVFLIDIIQHDGKGGIQNDCSGNNPWNGGADFTGMDNAIAYWAHADYVLQRAAAYGITVLAGTAFHGSFDDCSIRYFASMEKTSDATLTAYGAFLGNRYKSYPNIIWLHGGDANPSLCASDVTQKEGAIARGIMSADPIHLMAIESTNNQWGEASATNWAPFTFSTSAPNGWLTLGTIYPKGLPATTFSKEIAHIVSQNVTETGASAFVPYFSIEDPYEYEPYEAPYTVEQLRQQGYTEVLSGAYLGRLFGSSGVWPFGATCCQHGPTWQVNMDHPASFDQQRLGDLFRSREHWRMVADLNHTVVTAGFGSGANLAVTSRTSDGQTIIAYIPNGNAATLTVDMTRITSAIHEATCWWYNPSSGAATLIGSYANSGTRVFTAPDSNDWVLVIDDASASLPAPGSP